MRIVLIPLLVTILHGVVAISAAQGQWVPTEDMTSGRRAHTATLLPSGKVLVAGGLKIGYLRSAELFDPTTGSWEATGSLASKRDQHTATLLASGKVLVAGGYNRNYLANAEVYEPVTGTWTTVGSLEDPRNQHTATLLPSGRVLVAGGFLEDTSLRTAELYDSTSKIWETTAPLAMPRCKHTATLLPSGKVLVAGGTNDSGFLRSTELYDWEAKTWTRTGDMIIPRNRHTATVLPSGEVLVVGGRNDSGYESSAEIYDPDTEAWEFTAPLTVPRYLHTATLLPSGKVLVVGGYNSTGQLSSCELYNPETNTWETVPSLMTLRDRHAAVLLPSGGVLVAGGYYSGNYLPSAEVYQPANGTWRTPDPLAEARYRHTSTLLPSGDVLVVGGYDNVPLASVELYDPAGTWTGTGSLVTPRYWHTATLLLTAEVLVAGGQNTTALASAELYRANGTWGPTGLLLTQRSFHTATLLPSGRVLVAGGRNTSPLASAELYDPASGTWERTGSLTTARYYHTATLLHSGKVLVVGGFDGSSLADAELYDPATGTWEATGSLAWTRFLHGAVLLRSGEVLVAGGSNGSPLSSAEIYYPNTREWNVVGSLAMARALEPIVLPSGLVFAPGGSSGGSLPSAELYDPATETWLGAAALATPRRDHRVTLLQTGEVLVTGGRNGLTPLVSTEVYRPEDFLESRRPVIQSASQRILYGTPLLINGENFRGDSEGSSGQTSSSAVNYPLVQLRALDASQQASFVPDPRPNFWDDPMQLTVSDLPPTLNPGPHLLTVRTAGVPSEPHLVEIGCSLVVTHQPSDQTVPVGATATFHVETQGGRRFQWQKDEFEIPGATEASYTTPPVSNADAGTTYQVLVDSGCTSVNSEPGVLFVTENAPPKAALVTPNGGEYWLLSDEDASPRSAVITWSMSDDVRVCLVEVSLWYSPDGGATYEAAPAGGGLPKTFGEGGLCQHPGIETTSSVYTIPTEPPSGTPGSLYQIRVEVTDHVGLSTTAPSENPFFIVRPNPDSVKTLILSNILRMQSPAMGISSEAASALKTNLQDLANHPRVQGLVVELNVFSSLTGLYDAWDADPGDPDKANDVLFAPGGIQHYLREELLATYTGVEYIVLVGDDRIIPMARIQDKTMLPEATYTDPVDGDLTAGGTSVGQALAQDRYLSDDLLAVTSPVNLPLTSTTLARGGFLPDLAIGRLVENPDEIIKTIASFISQDGVLDLGEVADTTTHKVLVTGYDFLVDSASLTRERWQRALGVPIDPDAEEPVDGQLISYDWGVPTIDLRRDLLRQHLSGNSGERYAINNLNGHATHFEVGVPGAAGHDIQGLSGGEIYGPHLCGSEPGIDLTGAVAYAVGCHGGLPVAGSCIDDPDHSLDLPQTMMARGVLAYVANSGYGWGLKHGIGQSERLIEIFTEDLIAGGTIKIGDAIVRSKLRYFLELPGFDVYDEKTLLQWTLFGLPMYSVRTGIGTGTASVSYKLPSAAEIERPNREHYGPVAVDRDLYPGGKQRAALPPHLTQLNLHFDFSAPGVYSRYDSQGSPLGSGPGCPDPDGCYYTLNGLVERSSGTPDLPIQPYFTYDSRLSGTSQHGALWMGGTYDEENGWIPVIAELMSNGGDFSDHGSTPRLIKPKPFPRGHRTTDDPECRPTDLELNSLVVIAGEALKEEETDPDYTRQRLYRDIDLEVLYFNDQGGGGNCDRLGPTLEPAIGESYHELTGSRIDWAVAATDAAGVWRVVVVYDVGPDAQSLGTWEPLELVDDGTGTWKGSLTPTGAARLTYLIQAVDNRGNVAWVELETTDLPASGVVHDLPEAFDVLLGDARADLAVDLRDDPDPVTAQRLLSYTVAVQNLGPDAANSVEVAAALPEGVTLLGTATNWDCEEASGTVTCTLPTLPLGEGPLLILFMAAPSTSGTLTGSVSVAALEPDPNSGNDSDVEQTFVTSGADLAVSKSDGGALAVPGKPLSYTISATNHGPEDVFGARLNDPFPAELNVVKWSCVATPGSLCTPEGSGDIADSVDLQSGGTAIYTATGMVVEGAVGPIANTASIAAPAGTGDPEPANDAASVITPVSDPAHTFGDGFESGDYSAWSSENPPTAIVVPLADQLPVDSSRFRGRSSPADVFDPLCGEMLLTVVVDVEGWSPQVVGELARSEGVFRLSVRLRHAAKSAPAGFLDMAELPRILELDWRVPIENGTARLLEM